MAYGPPLLACNTFLPTLSQHSWLYHNSVICIYCIRIFSLSMHALLHTHHHNVVVSLCTSFSDGSISISDVQAHLCQLYWCSLPDLDFSFSVCKAILPRTLSSIDATLCTASAFHAHALGPSLGPTCLPLGHTPSILASTSNVGDAHDAWVSVLPCTRHCHLLISGLVWGISHGTSLAMLCWIRDVPSSLGGNSNLAALRLTICNTLNGPTYWGQ